MKKYITVIASLLAIAGCQQKEAPQDNKLPESVSVEAKSVAGHENSIVAVPDNASGAVVALLASSVDVKSALEAGSSVNKKVTQECLLGGYSLCIIDVSKDKNADFVKDIKQSFPDGKKFYLLGYKDGGSMAYAAAMKYPEEFAAFGCVNGAIKFDDFKENSFSKPVAFVHVHGTENTAFLWDGKENGYTAAPLSVGAVVAADKCIYREKGQYLARDGYSKVSYIRYLGSPSGKEVMFYEVPGGGNGWCDNQFEVYHAIWNFFKKY